MYDKKRLKELTRLWELRRRTDKRLRIFSLWEKGSDRIFFGTGFFAFLLPNPSKDLLGCGF